MTKKTYDPNAIEPYWQSKWAQSRLHSPNLDAAKRPFYNLMMFPYPSAEGMHVGNMYAQTGSDIYGRFMRMKGKDVFELIGLDGFGIHSENYALKIGKHPMEQADISEKNFYRQMRVTGSAFDWERTVETYKPNYYKWTQWIFIQLFKAGLAYRKKAPVNFCPSCKTVLADEQVVISEKRKVRSAKLDQGIAICERCETPVEKRELEQWFLKITRYADRLLTNIVKLDWSEKVKTAQRLWIGKKEGTIIRFRIKDLGLKNEKEDSIDVFTTRADTLYGATFLVISPEHPIVASLLNSELQEVRWYVEKAKGKSEKERIAEGKEKSGVFSGLYATNPLNQEKLPVWIADYALMGYGTGALFGDAHDERDVKFAKKYKIALKVTVTTGDQEKDMRIKNFEECFMGEGILIDSGEFTGLKSHEAKEKVTAWLKDHKAGGPKTTYHLRDWLISRQRYWGPPIPMVYCKRCAKRGISYASNVILGSPAKRGDSRINSVRDSGRARMTEKMPGWFPVPEKDLPVLLPDVKDWKPKGAGKSPLSNIETFVNTKCPNCNESAKRETDVSDTFLDSAWYFFRYASTDIDSRAFDTKRVKKWLPVNMYIGGAEHSVLHLLYARFITMALKDLGLVDFDEPFKRFYAHGLILAEGGKMSKSKGNVVVPDAYIRKFGADTLRCYLMFLGPFNQGGEFRDSGIEGMHRFLKRVWRLISEYSENSDSQNTQKDRRFREIRSSDVSDNQTHRRTEYSEFSEQIMHKTIKKVTEDISSLHYNTAIASLMEWYNFLSDQGSINVEEISTYIKLLAPFAPHMTEELWHRIKNNELGNRVIHDSIHRETWPNYDPKFLQEDEVVIVVQINGRLRDTIKVQSEKLKVKSHIEDIAKRSKRINKYLEGRNIQRVIYVEGKLVNFVV